MLLANSLMRYVFGNEICTIQTVTENEEKRIKYLEILLQFF